jgi:predicted dienelactone hydrolase
MTIEKRITKLENKLISTVVSIADMPLNERDERIRVLTSKKLNLDHVMTQEEYEGWLVDKYHDAAYSSTLPLYDESLPTKERIEALEAYEAWFIVHRFV